MSEEEFVRLEYQTLREEIKQAKDQAFKTLLVGVTVVPGAQFLAQAHNIDAITVAMPLFVLVIALLYLATNHTIMRCGRYIRLQIEPRVEGLGWESWLVIPDEYEKRSVDRLLSQSFYLLFALYFSGSTFLAVRFAWAKYGSWAGHILLSMYLVLGVCFAAYLVAKILVSTTTKVESSRPPAHPSKKSAAPSDER